jgi:hypothetical protein
VGMIYPPDATQFKDVYSGYVFAALGALYGLIVGAWYVGLM